MIELAMAGAAALMAMAGAAAVVGFSRNARAEAASAGLELGLLGQASGTVEGFAVQYRSSDNGSNPSKTTVELGFQLPELHVRTQGRSIDGVFDMLRGRIDITLGTSFDQALHIHGADKAAVRALLTDPAVQAAIRGVLGTFGELLITPRTVVTHQQGPLFDDVALKVNRAVALAVALRDRFEAPWKALGEAHGLTAVDTPDARVFEGEVGGASVRVEQARLAGGDVPLRVRVVLTRPLPPGTELVHIDRGKGPSAALADPILGAQVHAVSTDPDALSTRLSRDAVRGPLLEVVHGHPGSRVTSEAVELLVVPAPLDPKPAVDLALELERALREASSSS